MFREDVLVAIPEQEFDTPPDEVLSDGGIPDDTKPTRPEPKIEPEPIIPPRQPRRVILILLLTVLCTMILLDRPLIRGDGLSYLVWIDTLAGDFDINLNNQHDRFREINTYQIQWDYDTERWVNIFPFGIAYLQAPFYWLGAGAESLGILDANPDYFNAMQGVSQAKSVALMLGANLMALIACALAFLIGRRFCADWLAAVLAFLTFLATPIIYYSTVMPINSHNPGAFTLAVFVYALVRCVGVSPERDPERSTFRGWWILLGVFAGLSVLVRWQLAAAVAPAWILLIYTRHWRGLSLATLAAGLTVLPLPFIWNAYFGAPVLVPFDAVNDNEFIQQGNHALDVLGMLIAHSPIVLLSFAGLPFLWRINRAWALLFGAMIVSQLVVNGAALDWSAGETYGMRRMSELYVVYAVLACCAVGGLLRWIHAREWWRYGRVAVYAGLTMLFAYSLVYLTSFIVYSWHDPQWMFDNSPQAMIAYFANLPHRWQILWEIYRSHLGPLVWGMPGA
ncbi:MAG: glycosyltransferase family 39 protein [Aggregatilineales bacterium]